MGKAIHVLEDDVDIGELIAFLLREQGFEVSVFNSIASFNQRDKKGVPILLIVDIMLPDGNGLTVCEAWKADKTTRNIPLVLMSAYSGHQYDARACAADGFISKPFDIDEFLAEVKRQVGINDP